MDAAQLTRVIVVETGVDADARHLPGGQGFGGPRDGGHHGIRLGEQRVLRPEFSLKHGHRTTGPKHVERDVLPLGARTLQQRHECGAFTQFLEHVPDAIEAAGASPGT